MMQRKKIYWLGFCAVLAISFALSQTGALDFRDNENLEVHFLDVGQGDAIFIETPEDFQILIDAGPDKSILTELGKVMSFSDRSIDMVILTHPHSDHVAGLVEVLRRYQINDVYLTGVAHTSNDYLTFLELIKQKNIFAHEVVEPFEIILDNEIKLQFVYPLESFSGLRVENLNNTSIVNRLVFGDSVALFTGDLEIEGEDEVLESGQEIRAQLFKAGHHGSSTSSQEKFIMEVSPEYAVISVGRDNSFGHPSGRTVSRFERLGIEIFRTDQDGAIGFSSDGSGWELIEQKPWFEKIFKRTNP